MLKYFSDYLYDIHIYQKQYLGDSLPS